MTVRRRTVLLASAAATVALGAALVLVSAGEGEGPSGAGFTYRGEFYLMSGAEVRNEKLGRVLADSVPMTDTTTDVREIVGVEPDVAVAAYVRYAGGTPAEGGAAWLLMSPDDDVAAKPWEAPSVSEVLVRPRS